MKVKHIYSHLNGLEWIKFHKMNLWEEILESINNVDPVPIAVTHSAMTIWVELLKNKYNLKNQKIMSKNLITFLQEVFEVFNCEADVKKSYMNWHNLKNTS